MRTRAGFTLLFCFVGILWAEDKAATSPTWGKIDEGVTRMFARLPQAR